ncbi:MAG: hypothetical protein H6Q14_1380 [Bacteroidetes bacterium]|nr:hypothetical protein [Bacteroidota bacterium]
MIDTKLVTDKEEQDYYNSLEPEIDRLVKLYNLPESSGYTSTIVTQIWIYRDTFISDDTFILELAEFTRILLNSKKTDNPIEVKYGNKKIKINNDLHKTRLNYVVNALLEHEVRKNYSLRFPEDLSKDFCLKPSIKICMEMYEQSSDKDDYSVFQIIDFSKVLYSNQEINRIIDIVKEKGRFQSNKYSKLKKEQLKDLLKETISTLKKKDLFNKNLKTIATNEACFLYDVFAFAKLIEHDSSANNQEKYQFIKRRLQAI